MTQAVMLRDKQLKASPDRHVKASSVITAHFIKMLQECARNHDDITKQLSIGCFTEGPDKRNDIELAKVRIEMCHSLM